GADNGQTTGRQRVCQASKRPSGQVPAGARGACRCCRRVAALECLDSAATSRCRGQGGGLLQGAGGRPRARRGRGQLQTPQAHGRYGEYVFGQHDEIGEATRSQRALVRLLATSGGGPGCVGIQGLSNGQRLVGQPGCAVGGLVVVAGDGGVQDAQ